MFQCLILAFRCLLIRRLAILDGRVGYMLVLFINQDLSRVLIVLIWLCFITGLFGGILPESTTYYEVYFLGCVLRVTYFARFEEFGGERIVTELRFPIA